MDIKLTVVAMLEAVTALLRAGYAPTRSLLFAFGHDEEVGGRLGAGETARLLRERGVELDIIFVSAARGWVGGCCCCLGGVLGQRSGERRRRRSRGGSLTHTHTNTPPLQTLNNRTRASA